MAWLNAEQNTHFELTGVVDYDAALANPDDTYELGLVLCDGELCAREQVRVEPGPVFSLIGLDEPEIPPLLDPPKGIRNGWLDTVLAKHEFVLLLFYRGLW